LKKHFVYRYNTHSDIVRKCLPRVYNVLQKDLFLIKQERKQADDQKPKEYIIKTYIEPLKKDFTKQLDDFKKIFFKEMQTLREEQSKIKKEK